MARNRFARGYIGYPPTDGGYPKAHPKDPELYPSRPYIPIVQSDQASLRKIGLAGEAMDDGLDFGQGHPQHVRHGLSRGRDAAWLEEHTFINATPLWQAPRVVTILATDTPLQLFQANPRRLAFTIGNNTLQTLFFSYGPPIKAGTSFLGIPIGAALGVFPNGAGYFQGSNGSASIQEIYVWLAAGSTVPANVLGYEGVLAPDAFSGSEN